MGSIETIYLLMNSYPGLKDLISYYDVKISKIKENREYLNGVQCIKKHMQIYSKQAGADHADHK